MKVGVGPQANCAAPLATWRNGQYLWIEDSQATSCRLTSNGSTGFWPSASENTDRIRDAVPQDLLVGRDRQGRALCLVINIF
jgi:hypothetical protein